MVDATHISFAANDRSYFSLLKKEIHKRAELAGFRPERLNALDLIVAEMTSNLFKYANEGEILMGVFVNDGDPYIEVISIDQGPGMANPAKMLLDGMSTTNTLGHGLGSIKRLSDVFDLYSVPDWGTIVLSRIYEKSRPSKKDKDISVHALVVSKPGETTSGDGFAYKQTGNILRLMLADGLGHGPDANHAVNEAAKVFKARREDSPAEMLRLIHTGIKKTRGAVINLTYLDLAARKWISTGIGNIAVRFIGPMNIKNHMSYNGIVGHNIPNTINDQIYPADQFNKLILCSDGIKTRWDIAKYPAILKHDPTVLAAAIYKDHARKTDDMSVIVAKLK